MNVERNRVTGVVVTGAAAVLVVTGCVLPWLTFSTPGGSVSFSGTDIHFVGSAVDGSVILTLALVAAACAGFSLLRDDHALPGIAAVLACATAGLTIYDLDDVGGRVSNAQSVSISYGLWLTAAASIVLIAGAVMTLNAVPSEVTGVARRLKTGSRRLIPGSNEYWVRDPYGRHEMRWWNGNNYTDLVIDDGVEGTDPPGVRAVPG